MFRLAACECTWSAYCGYIDWACDIASENRDVRSTAPRVRPPAQYRLATCPSAYVEGKRESRARGHVGHMTTDLPEDLPGKTGQESSCQGLYGLRRHAHAYHTQELPDVAAIERLAVHPTDPVDHFHL